MKKITLITVLLLVVVCAATFSALVATGIIRFDKPEESTSESESESVSESLSESESESVSESVSESTSESESESESESIRDKEYETGKDNEQDVGDLLEGLLP